MAQHTPLQAHPAGLQSNRRRLQPHLPQPQLQWPALWVSCPGYCQRSRLQLMLLIFVVELSLQLLIQPYWQALLRQQSVGLWSCLEGTRFPESPLAPKDLACLQHIADAAGHNASCDLGPFG